MTVIGPVDPVDGAGTVMLVSVHDVGVPNPPLKLTVLLPCLAPKLVPVIVTDVPTTPEVGEMLVIWGVGKAVK